MHRCCVLVWVSQGSGSGCHSRQKWNLESARSPCVSVEAWTCYVSCSCSYVFLMSTCYTVRFLRAGTVSVPHCGNGWHIPHSYLLMELNDSLNSSGPGYPCLWLCLFSGLWLWRISIIFSLTKQIPTRNLHVPNAFSYCSLVKSCHFSCSVFPSFLPPHRTRPLTICCGLLSLPPDPFTLLSVWKPERWSDIH